MRVYDLQIEVCGAKRMRYEQAMQRLWERSKKTVADQQRIIFKQVALILSIRKPFSERI